MRMFRSLLDLSFHGFGERRMGKRASRRTGLRGKKGDFFSILLNVRCSQSFTSGM